MTTIKAASPNRADIQAAVERAASGDIVEIPVGAVEWTGQLFAPDGIWIKGAGRNATKLLNKDDLSAWKAMLVVECKTGKPFKLSGIHFEGRLQALQGDNRTSNQTQVCDQGVLVNGNAVDIEIFDCRFTKFTRAAVEFSKSTTTPTGVIYENEFTDCWYSYLGYGVAINGASAAAWNEPLTPGSANMLFIEDNKFDRCRCFTAASDGAIYVARHNECIDNYQDATAFNMHGLTNAWPRGGRWIEVYNNTVKNSVKRNSCAGIAGGGGAIWGNRWANAAQRGVELMLSKSDKHPYKGYPHQDQIGFKEKLYIWDNDNTGINTPVSIRESNPPGGTQWVKQDRDFFCKPMPGYKPFAYPHPLRG
jgi:hypothetical protein